MSEKGLQIHLLRISGQHLAGMAGKQCRVSFQRVNDPSRRKYGLELVHSDICALS